MAPGTPSSGRYESLRRTGLVLARMAPLVTFGFLALGLSLFLDQSRDLLSDAQFTWGERRVMAAIAVVTVGSCVLAGWIVGRLFRAAADLIDVVADLGDSSWRTNELIERHVIPILGRIATSLEKDPPLSTEGRKLGTIQPEIPRAARQPESNQGRPGR